MGLQSSHSGSDAAVLLSSWPRCDVQGLFDFLPICNVRTLVPQIRTVEGEATARHSGWHAIAADFRLLLMDQIKA